jgi:GT2 family glycosyltransferase
MCAVADLTSSVMEISGGQSGSDSCGLRFVRSAGDRVAKEDELYSGDFAVIIPTRNRAALAFELVQYLRQTLRWDCPIIVIDQSDDRGAELAACLKRSELGGVTHQYQERIGTSCARNAGVQLAGADWFIFLDDDIRPASSYLKELKSFLAENHWLDAVQGSTEPRSSWLRYHENESGWEPRSNTGSWKFTQPWWNVVEWFTSHSGGAFDNLTIGLGAGNFAISRRAFVGSGGFDEQIEGSGEDREFGLRLWWYGYRVCRNPRMIAFHLEAPDGGVREKKKSRIRHLFDPEPSPGLIYFYLKWFPGKPVRALMYRYLRAWARRPTTFPVKLVRLTRSFLAARERLRSGPVYLSDPVPRSHAVQVNSYQEIRTEIHDSGVHQH